MWFNIPIIKEDKYQVNENKRWFQKWWPEGVPKNVEFPELTITEFFDEQAKKYAKDKLSETIKLTQSTGKISAATPKKVTEEETGVLLLEVLVEFRL